MDMKALPYECVNNVSQLLWSHDFQLVKVTFVVESAGRGWVEEGKSSAILCTCRIGAQFL